jgi:hypothetical protein
MSRNPFVPAADQTTEFGFGPGMFPNPAIDYSAGGQKSGFPIGDPDRRQQYLDLFVGRRTDLNRTDVPDAPSYAAESGQHPDYYTCGNTERYGANPPLVRVKDAPPRKRYKFTPRARMEREF